MSDPDKKQRLIPKIKTFFVRWKKGIKDHQETVSGMIGTKLLLLKFIIVGLFVGGLQLAFINDQGVIGAVLIIFGFVQMIDHKMLKKQYVEMKKQEELMKKLGR